MPWMVAILVFNKTKATSNTTPGSPINYKKEAHVGRADHGKFKILQQDFKTPQEVTRTCLTCHNKTGVDIMHTAHWKWTQPYITDHSDTIPLGKKNILNNFCIGISSNQPHCTSCHIGYGWKDDHFSFTDQENIDCIVCHDQTGTYKKFPTGAGYPVTYEKKFNGKTFYPPNLTKIAQNIGIPKKENCGACHYTGGGGNNIKHGDFETALNNTTKEVDVHMGIDGADMSCVECHKTERHLVTGKLYTVSSENSDRVTCEQCHTAQPHSNKILNVHTTRVSCQTCHIPTYAKEHSTNTYWDWSKAGKFNKDGSFLVRKDSLGNILYHTQKGSFQWGNNLQPEYVWFNGRSRHYLTGEKTDTLQPVKMNTLLGSYKDPTSKIIPVKIHRGRQIYDPINKTLIVPHLYGNDSTSYWKNFDWNKAGKTGMQSVDLPYSGQFAFVRTEMFWPLNHMVAPREQSLKCIDCHSSNSRLKGLNDFYMPGRDQSKKLDLAGILLIALAAFGVLIHGTLRIMKK